MTLLAAVLAALLPTSRGDAYVGTTAFGGLYGGEINDFAVNPADPRIVLVATSQGIFRTVDSGERWQPASAGLRHVRIWDLTFDVHLSTVAYAATNAGVFRSVDGGVSWTEAYATPKQPPFDSAVRVVSTPGTVYARTGMLLLASHDAGLTWSVIYGSDAVWNPTLSGMGAAPSDPDVVYLARTGDDGPSRLMRTSDGGVTWEVLPIESVYDVEVHPLDSDVAYANRAGFVYGTRDGGASWKELWRYERGPVEEIAVAPSGTVMISGTTRDNSFVARSEDGGASWTTTRVVGATLAPYEAVEVDPTNDKIVYYGTSGLGVYRSDDGAATFMPKNVGLTAQPVRGIAADPTSPSTMYATLGDGGLFRSDDGGTSWVDVNARLRDPSNPYRAFDVTSVAVGADGAVYVMREVDREFAPSVLVSTDRGQTWTRSEGFALDQWSGFLLAHPTLPGHVVVTSWRVEGDFDRVGRAFRTEDGGQTWSEMTGLEGAITAATVEAGSGRLLAATDGPNERLLESVDFGLTWRSLAFPLPDERVYSLAVDARTGRIYAGGYWQVVAHSDDGGVSWEEVWIPEMERPHRINVIAVDPLDTTQVFAGTGNHGLWFSRDRGLTWAPAHPGVQGQSVYAVMFPYASATPDAPGVADQAGSVAESEYVRYRAAYVGSANGTRSGLSRMLPRPHNRRRPTAAGTPSVGGVLTCDPRRWTRASEYRYRWLRAGLRISGATSPEYEVVRRDRDRTLRCRVVAIGPGGRDRAVSRGLRVP